MTGTTQKLFIHVLFIALFLLQSPQGSIAAENQPILRVAVISDLNHSYGTVGYDAPVRAAIKRVTQLKPDLVLCTGDMIAGQRTSPKLNRKNLEAMWQAFHETVTKPLHDAGIPFAPSPGNHDASALSGFQLERDVYLEQWQKYESSFVLHDGGNYPFNYTFSIKGVLFCALDATTPGALPSVQMQWLNKVLDNVGADSVARIVFGHLPVWSLTTGRERGILKDSNLEQLFLDKSVNLYLSGHQHGFYPFVHNGQRYVGQAALGSGPRRLIGDKKRSPRAFTFLEIMTDGSVTITAFTGADFTKPVDQTALPAKIIYNGTTINLM